MRKRLRTPQTDPKLDSFLRVNHAGERAAQTIYQGQLAVLKNRPEAEEIQHMMEQEVEHLETFEKLLNDYEVRPSALDPVWGAAGFLLGAGTAMLGTKAAMACTIAVEEVIGEHYQKQAENLGSDEKSLKKTIERFRDEELEHRDIAVDYKGREARHYKMLHDVIQKGCRTAIKIAEKI